MKLITCRECGEIREHSARGLCKNCYNKWFYHNNKNEFKKRYHNDEVFRTHKKKAVLDRQKKFQDLGLCKYCGKPVDYNVSMVRCPVCHFKKLDRENKRRIDRLSRGLCSSCGKRPLYTKNFCFECTNRVNERYRLPDVSGDLERARVFVEGLE